MAKLPKKRRRSKPLAAEAARTARYSARKAASDSKMAPATTHFVLGRDSFARISAVEGIHLTREMKRDLREFDRKRLSAAERRRAIVNKYGRKAT